MRILLLNSISLVVKGARSFWKRTALVRDMNAFSVSASTLSYLRL